MPHPKIMTQLCCHTHFAIVLEVPHPNPNLSHRIRTNLKIDLGENYEGEGGGRNKSLSMAPLLVTAVSNVLLLCSVWDVTPNA